VNKLQYILNAVCLCLCIVEIASHKWSTVSTWALNCGLWVIAHTILFHSKEAVK
jgi:hypothetical protein